MTQQEEQLLNGLIQRVNDTQLSSKDQDAENKLQNGLGRNPDALYILAQTVLVQQFAMEKSQSDLQAARDEIARLQQNGGEKHGSFLGKLFGTEDKEPPQPTYSNPAGAGGATYAPVQNAPQYPPPQQYPGQPYPPAGYPPTGGYYAPAPPPMGGGMFGGGGGFLQGAMQTAAGVVAGEMAFRAIEDIFSSGHERGFSGGNEVVNNYYDSNDRDDNSNGFGERLAQADGYDGGVSSDIEDRRGESHGFFDGGGSDSDTPAFDDNSSFDDGGSFDSGGGDDNY